MAARTRRTDRGGWANVRYRRDSTGIDYEGVTVEDALRESLSIDLRETANLRQPFFPWATSIHEPKSGPLDFDRFPFQRERTLPRITVRAGSEGVALEARIRRGAEWTHDAKRSLIERGYELTDAELRAFAGEPVRA